MSINYDKYIYSSTIHYIANSGKDENGKYKGGKAGDQSGHEAELRKWYNRPWSCILRYPSLDTAILIAQLSIEMCLNNNVGYDQSNRNSYWNQLKKVGYRPSAITTPCEEDCTAGVSANVKAAGYLQNIPALQSVPICTSRNMRAQFKKAGFTVLTDAKYLKSSSYLMPGDILLYENHHAACNITWGKKAPRDASTVSITGSSVYIRLGPGTNFAKVGTAHLGDSFPYLHNYSPNGNGWYEISYDSRSCWVSSKFSVLV